MTYKEFIKTPLAKQPGVYLIVSGYLEDHCDNYYSWLAIWEPILKEWRNTNGPGHKGVIGHKDRDYDGRSILCIEPALVTAHRWRGIRSMPEGLPINQ